MKRKALMSVGIIAGLVLVTGAIVIQARKQTRPPAYDGPIESLRIGTVKEYATLILVAQEQGLFRDNGLAVTTTEYTSGAPSLQALADGQVDMAVGSDFSGISQMFNTNDLQAITSIFDSPDVFQLIARKDRGISRPADLKGKKIGLTKKTMGEFFLGTFLASHGVSLDDVVQVDSSAPTLAQAIVNGTVDAVIDFQPYAYEIKKQLGDNAAIFLPQGEQLLYTLLYARRQVIGEHPDAVRRFVRALAEAERFANDHPSQMKDFFGRRFRYPVDYIEDVLLRFNFRLSLSQEMLIAMEDEARWAIKNKLTAAAKIPNYLDFIYPDALRQSNPEAVTIIR